MSRATLTIAACALLAVFTLTSCASNGTTNQVLQAYVGISSVMPRNDSTGVSVLAPGIVNFQDTVSDREAAVMSWTLTDASGALVPGSVVIGSTRASFTPDAPLQGNTAYRYTITTGVRMRRGQLVRDVFEWNFSTGDAPTAPVR